MGVVVAAQHLQLKQRVAIKFLLSPTASGSDAAARFLREAQSSARIQSDHVARVLDVATLDDGSPYMVMEFLEGRDLSALLAQRGPLPLEEAVGYILQACEGIAEAHAAGIVHRDLKPSNFYLCERGHGRTLVKVLDFGISKMAASIAGGDASLTQSTAIMGSPLYMSPEQMTSAKHVDERTDIWSLGATLFELTTGKPPFNGDSITEIIAKVLQTEPPSVQELRPDLSHAFAAALQRSLEKDRERRYPNVGRFAVAIAPFGPRLSEVSVERILQTLGLSLPVPDALQATLQAPAGAVARRATTAPAMPFEHAAPAGGTTTATPVLSPGQERSLPKPPNSSLRAMFAVVVLVGVGGAAWAHWGTRQGGPVVSMSGAGPLGPMVTPSEGALPSGARSSDDGRPALATATVHPTEVEAGADASPREPTVPAASTVHRIAPPRPVDPWERRN